MTAPASAIYGAADMRADWCTNGDEVCDIASTCTGCDKTICPEHCDDFTTCSDGGLHCGDCRGDCPTCQGDLAYDDYEDRYEQTWRGED